jgi:hypothetical protein
MDATYSENKILARDGLLWSVVMVALAALAFFMLTRDAQKQYGAVSFGVFPAFKAVDSQGKPFDEHRLHGRLTAIVVTDQALPNDLSLFLHKLSQATSGGKKYLKSLVLVDKPVGISDRWVEYMVLEKEEFARIDAWKEGLFKGEVILVDQNGVVRGVFDITDKLQRLNFEGAVKGIL